MKWVAVDLGTSNIKASVLDNKYRPVRLSYNMGSYNTTLLSAVVAVTPSGEVIIGDYASQIGVINPNLKVYDWLHSSNKSLIAKKLFQTIKESAIMHYREENIGVILLYDNISDSELNSIAEKVFYQVEVMHTGDVVKRILSPNSNLILIADFGESALRITIQEKSKCLYVNSNRSLGFSSVDMLSMIDINDPMTKSNVEIALLGQLMQNIKIAANNGNQIIMPDGLLVKGKSINCIFNEKITTFFYQCFEECSNALKNVSKSWKDINEVVFIGGAAHSSIINTVFEKYINSVCPLVSFNSKNQGFDAQFAASNCAIQVPHREDTGVFIKY